MNAKTQQLNFFIGEEKFLHYVWKHRLFNQLTLHTTKGETVEVLFQGEHNHQSGPDFFNARIKINGVLWVGNLEIHVNSSDWNLHKHQSDPAYENVILHVVFNDDAAVFNSKNELMPTLELKDLIPAEYFERYNYLRNSSDTIACGTSAQTVPPVILRSWFERLMTERLEEKIISIMEVLTETKNDFDETFYRCLAKNFGFKTNALPFYLLAKSIPLKILLRHSDNPLQIEALLFGQAGFLEGFFPEKYPQKLQNEYEFLKTKYSLLPLQKSIWKTGGMRPQNFPFIRIGQFAAITPSIPDLFHRLKNGIDLSELNSLLSASPNEFWNDHYTFETCSKARTKNLGHDGVQNIAVNTIIPFTFLIGTKEANDVMKNNAIDLAAEIPAEDNTIVRIFQKSGLNPGNALDSQAMLQLKKNYCDKKKCLECRIGCHLLSRRE